jgi:hypothetical protein
MSTRFSLAQVETVKANLDALPAADKDTREVGLQGAIKALAPTIRSSPAGLLAAEDHRSAARAGHTHPQLDPQALPRREAREARSAGPGARTVQGR